MSGPVDGIVVATTDDGRLSEVRLLAVRDACAWIAYRSASVVRSAILDPDDGTLFLHLVDRSSRGDQGVWRLPRGAAAADAGAGIGAEPVLVAPPLDATAVGTVWSTQLRLDFGSAKLAVQSCGDAGCLTRIFDLRDGRAASLVLGGPGQGDLLGFAGDQLITWSRCPGLPCSVVRWDPATGRQRILVDEAASAGLTGDGRRLVAVSTGADPRAVEVDPATGAGRPLTAFPPGLGALPGGLAAATGLEVAPDEIVIGSPAGDPRAFRPDDSSEVLP